MFKIVYEFSDQCCSFHAQLRIYCVLQTRMPFLMRKLEVKRKCNYEPNCLDNEQQYNKSIFLKLKQKLLQDNIRNGRNYSCETKKKNCFKHCKISCKNVQCHDKCSKFDNTFCSLQQLHRQCSKHGLQLYSKVLYPTIRRPHMGKAVVAFL